MNEYSNEIDDFLTFMRNRKSTYEFNFERAGELDRQQQDLLHDIEFAETADKVKELALDLYDVRKERRDAKDKVELSEPISDFCDKNKNVINALEKLLGEVRKIEKRQDNREYKRRSERL